MKTRLSGLLWLTGITAALLWVLPGFSQEQLPDLAQVKGAAERGDAQAQDRLGDSYEGRFSFSTAAEWFRKAAEQGVSHAQWRLGKEARKLIRYAGTGGHSHRHTCRIRRRPRICRDRRRRTRRI